eukprot:4599644-Pyramimonas_sp.AAC.1
MVLRYGEKCSQVTCFREAVGMASGVPLCLQHLGGDAARAIHDHPAGVGFFAGLRRRARRSPAPRSRAPERAATTPARSRTPERSAPTTSALEAPPSPGDPVPAPAGPPS